VTDFAIQIVYSEKKKNKNPVRSYTSTMLKAHFRHLKALLISITTRYTNRFSKSLNALSLPLHPRKKRCYCCFNIKTGLAWIRSIEYFCSLPFSFKGKRNPYFAIFQTLKDFSYLLLSSSYIWLVKFDKKMLSLSKIQSFFSSFIL
jgi:hypothetical protein